MKAEFRIKKDDKRTAPKTVVLAKTNVASVDEAYSTAKAVMDKYREENTLDEYCEYYVEMTLVSEIHV